MRDAGRREWLQRAGAWALMSALSTRAAGTLSKARVLVVGGGYGGATAARYLRILSGHTLDVVLIEPEPAFVSCPFSNLVLGGSLTLADLTTPYTALERDHGVRVARDFVVRIDATKKQALLASGTSLGYDKLVLSPGIEMMWDEVEGLHEAQRAGRIVQAWRAGAETLTLRRQLEALPDGGVYAVAIPELPYRCPPAPYERACQVANYFKAAKPRCKLLVLDANPEITSKPALFRAAWAALYPGMIEYRPQHKAVGVDASGHTLRFEVQDDVQADVLNVLPPMRAGTIAVQTGLANANARWCHVDWLNFESTAAKDIHILGDALQAAAAMPKSAHMANGQARVAAAAIVAELAGREIDPAAVLVNTCYSHVDARQAMHVASVHAYVAAERTFEPVAGAGSLSSAPSAAESEAAWRWARTLWADALG